MAKRRGKGEGSVYQRADGYWVGAISVTCRGGHKRRDGSACRGGERRKVRVVRSTQAKAIGALRDLQRHDTIPDRSTTVAVLLRYWLDNGQRDGTKAKTVGVYRSVCEQQLIPRLGRHKLADLTTTHVTQMLADMANEGRAPGYRSQCRAVLVRGLRWAQRQEPPLVVRNVAQLVDGPKMSRQAKRDDVLNRAQAELVLATAARRTEDRPNGDPYELAAVLGLRLALRIGEVTALRWDDVDLDGGELHIRRSKTDAGVRTLPLIDAVVPALRARKAHQAAERLAAGPLWRDTGYVLTMPDGSDVDDRWLRGWWYGLCERAKIGRRRFHAARHTAATLMLDDGVKLEVVSAVCGHATLSMTADLYAKVTKDGLRRGLAVLNSGTQPTPPGDVAEGVR